MELFGWFLGAIGSAFLTGVLYLAEKIILFALQWGYIESVAYRYRTQMIDRVDNEWSESGQRVEKGLGRNRLMTGGRMPETGGNRIV